MKSVKFASLVKARILVVLIPVRDKLLKCLGRTDFETIYFEGGLGSQILTYIEFLLSPRKVDLKYFKHPPIGDHIGPDIWDWELDRYGIKLDDFSEYENSKPFNPWITRRPSTLEYSSRVQRRSSIEKLKPHKNIQEHFPINTPALIKALEEFEIELDKTVSIHIRRGDYVRVASRLVEYREYENVLKSISLQPNYKLLFLSDSELPSEVKEYFKKVFADRKVEFFSENDISTHLTHDLMRMSKVLITANSTFSISAGLLSDANSLVLSPIEFFGGEDGYLKSRIFNRYGQFFVLGKNFLI